MKKVITILAILAVLIGAAPAMADYRGTGTWTSAATNAHSVFVADLPTGEVEFCNTPSGTTPNCVVEFPQAFNGRSYWIRTYNSVGQFAETAHAVFVVNDPVPASGVLFNWQHFIP